MLITPKTSVCYMSTSNSLTVLEQCNSKQEVIEFIKKEERNIRLAERPLFLIDAKLYKIKWLETDRNVACEREAFVIADNIAQIVTAYPTLTRAEEFGKIANDLRRSTK